MNEITQVAWETARRLVGLPELKLCDDAREAVFRLIYAEVASALGQFEELRRRADRRLHPAG